MRFLSILIVASFYYTAGAILDRSGRPPAEGRTMDGLAFLKDSSPGEYAAIQWLRDQAEPGRIIEAVGNDYSDHGAHLRRHWTGRGARLEGPRNPVARLPRGLRWA